MLWSVLLLAAPWQELPTTSPAATENFGLSNASPSASPAVEWENYQAAVTSQLNETAPPPPPPGPVTAPPPAEMGLSSPSTPATCQTGACDANAYGGGDCGCKDGWLHRLFHCCGHCSTCGIHSTCDMIPHYPYPPSYHGYYYFQPYNYTHVAAQQQIATRLGADQRNPYTTHLLDNLFESIPEPTLRSATAVGKVGTPLPKLEDLLESK